MTNDDLRRSATTELTPNDIVSVSFRYVRRGYDAEEVDHFLAEVAQVVDRALSQATAMEARARAAVARLNDQSGSADKSVGEANAETITRTLLMAQRAADAAVEEAKAEADQLRLDAAAESERVLGAAQRDARRLVAEATARADELVETARDTARQVNQDERRRAIHEVEELLARREALVGDVDQIEQFLIEQRERLRSTARQLEVLCERIPGGLGSVPPPSLADSGEPVGGLDDAGDAAPDNTVLDDTVPDDTVPDDTVPDDTALDDTAPDDAAPDDTDAAEVSPDHDAGPAVVAEASAPADPRVTDETAPLDRAPEQRSGLAAGPDTSKRDDTPVGRSVVDHAPLRLPRGDAGLGRPTPEELGTIRLEIAALVDPPSADGVGEFDDTGEFEPTTELRLPPN